MPQHYILNETSFELARMPFYWRLSNGKEKFEDILQELLGRSVHTLVGASAYSYFVKKFAKSIKI